MKRVKPKKAKNEKKQVHFEMDLKDYIEFEKEVYSIGYSVSDFFRDKAKDFIKYKKDIN